MRNLSAGALATLASSDGIEPILLVAVSWVNGQVNIYSDRSFPELGYEGRLLEVTPFDSFVNIETGNNNATVTIKLEDSDGQIKTIFNNCDIQKRPVTIYQWFSNLAPSDAFIVFEGLINSPMVWNEGDRTLSFEAITHLEDVEFGFAVEDGQFSDVPVELVGKPWPVPFGTVINMRALQIDQIPHGVTRFNYGIEDSSLARQMEEIQCQQGKVIAQAACMSRVGAELEFDGQFNDAGVEVFNKGQEMQHRALDMLNSLTSRVRDLRILVQVQQDQRSYDLGTLYILNGWKFRQGIPVGIVIGGRGRDNPATGAHYYGVFHGDVFTVISRLNPYETIPAGAPLAPVLYAQAAAASLSNQQASITKKSIVIPDSGIVQEGLFDFDSDDDYFTATPLEKKTDPCGPHNLFIISTGFCERLNGGGSMSQAPVREGKFYYIPAGAPVAPDFGYPIRYVVSIIPGTVVLSVQAKATYQGIKVLIAVPNVYWSVSEQTFGTVTATIVTLAQPLHTIYGYDFENELFVSVQSPIGPNVMDILAYIIERWAPGYALDGPSFAACHTSLAPFPANFYLEERKNVFDVIRDICYQARLMASFGEGTFFFDYLPLDPTPVDSISESDVESKSLEVTTTRTEDLITQYKAHWTNNYANQTKNVWILQNNVAKYGLHKKDYQIQIFNEESLVEKTALFWLLRTSNTFKILKCKLLIHKLNLEVLDTVTLDFTNNYVANGPVPGLILKSNFNPTDWTIDCEIWVPVILGTMVQFKGANAADYADDVLGIETEELGTPYQAIAVSLGSGGYDTTVTVAKVPKISASDQNFNTPAQSFNGTTLGNGQVTQPRGRTQLEAARDFAQQNQRNQGGATERGSAPGAATQNSGATDASNAAQPGYQYWYKVYKDMLRPSLTFNAGAVPGQIVSKDSVDGDGAIYNVNLFLDGLDKPPTAIKVKQLQLDPAADIPANTWVLVDRQFYITQASGNMSQPKVTSKYFMQVTVWLKDS